MLVKALIREVRESGDAQKPMAVVTLEVTNPLEIVEVRLFKNSYSDGTVHRFKQMLGVECEIPLQAEIYNNRLSFNVPFGQTLSVPAKAMPAATLGGVQQQKPAA